MGSLGQRQAVLEEVDNHRNGYSKKPVLENTEGWRLKFPGIGTDSTISILVDTRKRAGFKRVGGHIAH